MIRKAWTAYAAALTGIMLAGEVLKLVQGTPVDFRTLANWIITGVLLTSLWGYALRRRIGAQYYWRAACWVVMKRSSTFGSRSEKTPASTLTVG